MRILGAEHFDSGGMGCVVHLHDFPHDGDVVGKYVRPSLIKDEQLRMRHENEADLAISFSGEQGLPQVRELVRGALLQFRRSMAPDAVGDLLVMDKVNGKRLDHVDYNYLNTGRCLAVAADLAFVLSNLHRNGVIHRDVKPENVFVNADGRVTLIDFSLSGTANRPLDLRDDGKPYIIGTPPYMAPEALFGNMRQPESDQFALGQVLMGLLSRGGLRSSINDIGDFRRDFGKIEEYELYKSCWWNLVPDENVRAQIFNFLTLQPIEHYNLWLMADAGEIRSVLQGRLDDAFKRFAPDCRVPVLSSFGAPKSSGPSYFRSELNFRLGRLASYGLPAAVVDIIRRLMAMDFSKRYNSVYTAAHDLAVEAVKLMPELRAQEPFYTLLGRVSSPY